MPQNYTPVSSFGGTPVVITSNGSIADENEFNTPFQDLYDRVFFNNDLAVETEGRFDALLIKLGLGVTSPTDTALPTYGVGFVLTAAQSHHTAIETLESTLQAHQGNLQNINTNVGGDVINAGANTYLSTFFISNGQPHHTALETLDTTSNTINTSLNTTISNLNTLTTRVDNIVPKVGTGADLGPTFNYSSNEFLVDGQSLKQGAEKIDAVLSGARRSAESAYELTLRNWEQEQTSIEGTGYDTFFDNSKVDPATTATVDVDLQKATASGATQFYFTKATAANTCTKMAFRWHESTPGSVVVKFNLINSINDIDMFTVTGQDIFETALAAGTQIVVKVEIPDGESLFDISFLAQV